MTVSVYTNEPAHKTQYFYASNVHHGCYVYKIEYHSLSDRIFALNALGEWKYQPGYSRTESGAKYSDFYDTIVDLIDALLRDKEVSTLDKMMELEYFL